MGISNVENRPEAPWIKRNDNVIIFTDNFIENEAYYVEDIDELMMKMDNKLNKTLIRDNVEMIFQKYQEEILKKGEKIKGNFLVKILIFRKGNSNYKRKFAA